ncbi:MAG: SRPBCC family protein [Gammaproteobacteria bacterium]
MLTVAVSVSGELLQLSVTEAGDEYRLRVVAVLDAPKDYVYQVITDYRHAYRINPAITSIEILPTEHGGVTLVKNRSTHRVGFFTFKIEWAGDIAEAGEGRLEIATIPELSSFESGSALWEIRPEGDRTWVLHESTLKLKFYILPVIGSYLLKRHMEGETLDTFHRIECNARVLLERDMQEDPEGLKVILNENRDCVESRVYEASQEPGQR